MYALLLTLHNVVRWIVVILAVYALARAYSGWLGKRAWVPSDRQAGMLFSIAMDIQVLLGILLIGRDVFRGVAAGLGPFFLFWHIPLMIAAAVLVHIGTAASRKAADDAGKHRLAAIWFTIAMVAVLVAIPWTRPLLRLG
jgi:uncharacterized membrane protein